MGVFNEHYPPIVLDIEASGFGRGGYPIEIGYIDSSNKRFCALIQPQPDWTHWDEEAQQAHGISRAKLQRYGVPAIEIARELNHRLQGKTLYSDGWVLDHPWLMKLYYEVKLLPSFRLSAIEMILNESQIAVWDSVRQEVIRENQLKRHRASIDAYIIQQTWIRSYALTRADNAASASI